jgi:WD40 repeat protein
MPGDRTISSEAPIRALSFSADGSGIAALCEDRQVRLWDAQTGELKRAFPLKDPAIERVTLAPGADLIASASHDGDVQLWDIKTGATVGQFKGPVPRVRDFAFSADRKLLAGSNNDGDDTSENEVRIWDASGKEQRVLKAGLGGISALAFSPDGSALVAATLDTNLRAWSTRDGELLRVMNDLPLATFAMAFSPDGKYLATGGADRIVYLWDTKTWKISRKLSGQAEMISSLAFSPDSRLLLTGGFSEFTEKNPVQAIFWDIDSGKPLRRMASANIIRAAAFSPDGTRAATANLDKSVSVWGVPAAKP